MSNPATLHLDKSNGCPIYQGETFSLSITAMSGTNVMDLSGYSGKAEVRETYSSSEPALQFSMTSAFDSSGVIALSATTSSTVNLSPEKKYKWDFIIFDAQGHVIPVCYGDVQVLPRITRL